MPPLSFAALLPLLRPALAALAAQAGDGLPVVGYGAAAVATVVVLLVVCWPARRRD